MQGVGITFTSLVVVVLGLCATAIASSCDFGKKPTPALNRTDSSPAGILKLLHEGQKLLELQEDDRDMVVFMGITGSGKTTFVLHIGGNDDDLTSKETRPRSREYIIEDKCNRSSSAAKTLESFTLVPDRFVDSETKKTYFDLPGFSDTRPLVAYDIAATYFTKMVLDFAKRIKLVFVVNHSHVKVGEDRGRFTELVNHITTLIRDVKKFRDSIALIVSKVSNTPIDSTYGSSSADFPYVPDEEVVEGIADFLSNAKSVYLEESGGTKAVQLMDIFLEKTNNSYSRIGIFRKPDRPGPLQNVTSLQRNKRNLKAIIDKNIRYSEKNVDDFGYTLSERSKNTLYKLREEVLKNTTAAIRAIAERIQTHYADGERNANDLDEVVNVVNEYSTDYVKAFRGIADFTDFVEMVHHRSGWLNMTAESTKEIRNNEKSLNFLIGISGQVVDWTPAIRNGTEELADFLRHSRSWYTFLETMYDTFSEYEVQVQRAKALYNNSLTQLLFEIEKLRLRPSSARMLNLTELTTMKPFLKDIGSETLSRMYDSLGPIGVNEPKLRFLQMILNATVDPKNQEQMSCEHDKFVVKGRYILVSRVANELSSSCPRPHSIQILASERIFIDTSLNLTGRGIVDVSMIAPVWIAKGRVEITLDGEAGKQPAGTRARDGISSSQYWLRNGENGEPGRPGGPAGNFAGIGANFINADQITISTRGGKGGNGQRGGDGHAGADSNVARPYNGGNTDFDSIWPGFSVEITEQDLASGFWAGVKRRLVVAEYRYTVKVFASPGESGGNGGDGGAGGEGGRRGTILLTNLNACQSTSMRTIAADGDAGNAGKSGRGAKRGQTGRTLVEVLTVKEYWQSTERTLQYVGYSYPQQWAQDGSDGTDGANHEGQQSPARVISSLESNDTLDDFRAFARSSLPNMLRKNALKQMLEKLGDMKIMNLHSAYATLPYEKKLQACHSSQNVTRR